MRHDERHRTGPWSGRDPLPRLLGDWLKLVHTAARRRPIPLNDQEYQRLHRALLTACEARASDPGRIDGNRWSLVAIQIRPFLDPESLARADPEILRGLTTLAGGRPLAGPPSGWRLALIRLLATVATALIMLQFGAVRQPTLHGLRTAWESLRLWLARHGLEPVPLLAMVLFLILAIRLIGRPSGR